MLNLGGGRGVYIFYRLKLKLKKLSLILGKRYIGKECFRMETLSNEIFIILQSKQSDIRKWNCNGKLRC